MVVAARMLRRWRRALAAAFIACFVVHSGMAIGQGAKVTIAVLPALDSIPIYVADARGFFRKEGIDANIQRFQGGPAVLQAVLAGGAQFAHAGTVPFINATARNAELQAIGVNAFFNARTKTMGIFVRRDSGINSVKELAGHTVAINQRGNMESMIIATQMLAKEGMPTSALNIVELPYPLMQKSVDGKRVDAAIGFQPFTQLMAADPELKLLAYLDTYIPEPGYAITFAVVSAAYAKANPEVAKRYVRALSQALEFARQDPGTTAEIAAKAFALPEKVTAPALKSIEFPNSETEVDPATWNNVVAGMKKVGAIPASYAIERFVGIGGK